MENKFQIGDKVRFSQNAYIHLNHSFQNNNDYGFIFKINDIHHRDLNLVSLISVKNDQSIGSYWHICYIELDS